ncbi:MAG: flagellar basal body-associated FliL family protein [Desulfobacterales bacterium]|nr:flagellar basal body-associated FliL family protein [Desulfobacterales bacterium]
MSKKVIIIVAAVSVLLIGAMGAGFFVIWSKVSNMATIPPTEQAADEKVAEEAEAKTTIGPIFSLESFVVNLNEDSGKRYLRVTMDLELSTEALSGEITKRLPQVRNSMLMILPSKKYEEISTIEGKNKLRDEIVVALNEFLQSGTVSNLYFSEFVVQ